MPRRTAAAVRSTVLAVLVSGVAAVSQNELPPLDRASLRQALSIAAGPGNEHRTFHARYTFAASAPVENIEIVT